MDAKVSGGDGDTAELEQKSALQLILSIGRAFKFVDDHVRPPMAKLGLTMTEFSVLATLFHGGPTPLGELSQRILLTGASTTYTVKKLEQRGLLTRRAKPEDQRVILGSITEKGTQVDAAHLPPACAGPGTFHERTLRRGEADRDDTAEAFALYPSTGLALIF